ncbi:MAG: Hint domain-containing protein [Myxococcota bacterium]|nr:Hint domain-containing protein [Myxococcota bacterium]
MDPDQTNGYAQQALAVYAESLAVGKRVAVFGDASLGIGARLAELGARAVHIWDPHIGRARLEASRAPRGVVVRPLVQDDVDLRAGAFDLAIVPDLGLFADADALLERVRHLVGDDGVALVAAGRTGAPRTFDYYELFDRVAQEFEDVCMIAQLPFYGVALAELGTETDSPAVTVDTQLVDGDRSPEVFLALASQRGVRLDPYTIVELPAPREVERQTQDDDEADEEELAEDTRESDARDELAGALLEARVRIDALEAQIADLRAHLAAALEVASAAEPLHDALRESASRLVELEQALALRAGQLAELSIEADALRAALHSSREGSSLIEPLRGRAERAEAAVAVVQAELRRASETHAAELARYEEGLRERAQAIRLLESEVGRRERIVRDLIAALEERGERPLLADGDRVEVAPSQAPSSAGEALVAENFQLRAKLDELALEVARREAEAQAAAWSVTELERQLAMCKATPTAATAPASPAVPPAALPAPAPGEIEQRLGIALDELNVLRRALAQEHEARLRAESGDELARAREEIQRQAILLEQLRAPPV